MTDVLDRLRKALANRHTVGRSAADFHMQTTSLMGEKMSSRGILSLEGLLFDRGSDKSRIPSRREFLSAMGKGTVALGTSTLLSSAVAACGGDITEPEPPPPPPPLEAVITGDTDLQIPFWGGSVEGQYDSAGSSSGTVSWKVERDNGGFGYGSRIKLEDGVTAKHDFTIPGIHTVTNEVSDGVGNDTAELKVRVVQAEKPATDYALIAFLHYDNELLGISDGFELSLMQADDHSIITSMVRSDFLPDRLSWEPGGNRIVYSRNEGRGRGWKLFVYDFRTGDETKIASGKNDDDSQQTPTWSRTGRIAFIDNSRTGDIVELAFVNPDGSDLTYPAGPQPDNNNGFMCFDPSWAPDGEEIALGGAYYYAEHVNDYVNRVRIFNPATRNFRNLNSEEKIIRFINTHYPGREDEFHHYFGEGVVGASWSPDGEWIVYVAWFGAGWTRHALLRSRVDDDDGEIEMLAEALLIDKELRHPCWTPDSQHILYAVRENNFTVPPEVSNIWIIPADGSGEAVKLTDDADHRNEAPTYVGL